MKEEYYKWYSPSLSMDIEMLVFGTHGYPIILFPTSGGRYFEAKDFKLIDSVAWFLDEGLVKIYCPDSMDRFSWYNKNVLPAERAQNHIWYDLAIYNELVPRAQKETVVNKVATAGCGFGGYHATNFGFRHPEVVKYIFNMGAAYDIKAHMDGYYDDNVFFNNPMDFLPNDENPAFRDLMIVLGTGTHDMCWDVNEKLAAILKQKQINYWLDVRENAIHDWPSWREMFPYYLSLIK